jgi:hypothetical protein
LTYLLKTEEQKSGLAQPLFSWDWLGAALSKILFDWPSAYGLKPQRPLLIMLGGVFVFGLVYWLGIRFLPHRTLLFVTWQAKNPRKGQEYVTTVRRRSQRPAWREELRLLRVAFYFSLLSAFRIGWKHYDVGMWIDRLQSRDYSLNARYGWIKSLCGLQALLSVYLLALWAMTQFGQPFD